MINEIKKAIASMLLKWVQIVLPKGEFANAFNLFLTKNIFKL